MIPTVVNGHRLEWDPPAALTSMRRYTCADCGAALLVRPDGSTYGSAVASECVPREEPSE